MKSDCEIRFGGHDLVLDASGALWWPAKRILTVSDLHFEKATYLGQHGSLIAPYDTLDTLDRLDQLIAKYQPEEIIFLGDSFHDAQAWQRLDASLKQRIVALAHRIRWIEGNHDITLRAAGLPRFEASYICEGVRFTHDTIEGNLPHIIGHYHPKMVVAVKHRRASGRCFAHTDQVLLLPAFGSFTGGLNLTHSVFKSLFKNEAPSAYLLHRDAIYKIPL